MAYFSGNCRTEVEIDNEWNIPASNRHAHSHRFKCRLKCSHPSVRNFALMPLAWLLFRLCFWLPAESLNSLLLVYLVPRCMQAVDIFLSTEQGRHFGKDCSRATSAPSMARHTTGAHTPACEGAHTPACEAGQDHLMPSSQWRHKVRCTPPTGMRMPKQSSPAWVLLSL